ncbi:phospholipase A2 inhibitor beta-like [Chrysoperla carnea]|uniref:phospholipase A2 inhibitor beta-like n=1 Tax=Chrysoperla carnea TaxID=189513 RepID=UPI001D07C662|nr:phospholipase A2 inhibitor beta-like [Chrysoperla carnea]
MDEDERVVVKDYCKGIGGFDKIGVIVTVFVNSKIEKLKILTMIWTCLFGLLLGLHTVSSYKDCQNEDFNDTEPPSVYPSLSEFISLSQGKSCRIRINWNLPFILQSGALNTQVQWELIRKIDLHNNQISEVQHDPFAQSGVCLVILDLSHNVISIIKNNAFSALRYLQKLDLSYNNLAELNNKAFASTNQIDFINLSNNKFKTIDNLTTLKSITVLKLANNQLKLHSGMFKNFPILLDLDLSGNKISYIPPDCFKGIIHLKNLSLGFNQLHTFEIKIFSSLPLLKFLNLSSNLLSSTELTNKNVFRQLRYINTLLLDGNTKLTDLNVTSLKNIFPKLLYLGADEIPWSCDGLTKFINDCQSLEINIISKNVVLSTNAIHGTSCSEENTTDHNNFKKLVNETVSKTASTQKNAQTKNVFLVIE